MAHRITALSLLVLALSGPAAVALTPSEADGAVVGLCKRLNDSFPEVYCAEVRASLLADFLARNGLPRGLCPLLGITCGPGESSNFQVILPPKVSSLLGDQLKRLIPTERRPAGAGQGAVDAYLTAILSIANPRSLASSLLKARRCSAKLTVSERKADGERFDVIDFADLCMPVSLLGHLLRMKLWVGTDGLIRRATLYTSLHGILHMCVDYAELRDALGRRLKVPKRVSISPTLSEHSVTPTDVMVLEFINPRIPEGDAAPAKDGDSHKRPKT
jgi:hypothetical protein